MQNLIQETSDSKILFTGLDFAGKTSIITILQKRFEHIALLKPTKAAQRNVFEYLGHSIAEWDLGGQQTYRIKYLKHPDKYFDNTHACLYVVDIQDEERTLEMLSYFKDVVDQFRELEITPSISVLFHKYDPEFVAEQNKASLDGKIKELEGNMKTITDGEFSLSFYRTTIKKVWGIFNAFSRIMLSLFPQSELIDKSIEEFAKKTDAKGIVVLDNNSLIIGQFYTNQQIQDLIQVSTPYFLTLNDSFSTKIKEESRAKPKEESDVLNGLNREKRMTINRSGHTFVFDEFFIEKFKVPFYLLIVKGKEEINDVEINSFIATFQTYI